jgi:hypothetical protein
MNNRMKWFCTVGYKHKIRIFINSKEDNVLLKLRLRNRKTTDEMFIQCSGELGIFIDYFKDHLEEKQLTKMLSVRDKLDKYCQDYCNGECIYKADNEYNEEDIDDDYENQLDNFIAYGLT